MLRPTPTVLELANKSIAKHVGVLDDIIVTVASWEYPMEFLVIHTKDPTKENPIILLIPCIATNNSFIGCREGILTISNGPSHQNLTMYPPSQPVAEMLWLENQYGYVEVEKPLLSISKYRGLEDQTKDNILDQFTSATTSVYFPHSFFRI